MIDICILGTSGMSPLVNRHLSSAIVRCDGAAFCWTAVRVPS